MASCERVEAAKRNGAPLSLQNRALTWTPLITTPSDECKTYPKFSSDLQGQAAYRALVHFPRRNKKRRKRGTLAPLRRSDRIRLQLLATSRKPLTPRRPLRHPQSRDSLPVRSRLPTRRRAGRRPSDRHLPADANPESSLGACVHAAIRISNKITNINAPKPTS